MGLALAALACSSTPSRAVHPWPKDEGLGWRCLAHHPIGSYESTCERSTQGHIDDAPFGAGRLAWCGFEERAEGIVQPVAACFRHSEGSSGHWLCMARMDNCEATRT